MCERNLTAWMAKKKTFRSLEHSTRTESLIRLWDKRVDLLPGQQLPCKTAKLMLLLTDLHSTSSLQLRRIFPGLMIELASARHSTKRTFLQRWAQESKHMEIYIQSKDHLWDRSHQPVLNQLWLRLRLINWLECHHVMRATWTRATSGWRRAVIE